MIELQEYAQKVHEMRVAQNEYFRTRAQVAMDRAKKIEKEVDQMTKQIVLPAPAVQDPQAKMF